MNQTSEFRIRTYGWQELACLYNPGVTPHTAVKKLKSWVEESPGLKQKLLEAEWKPKKRLLTPRQVEVLVTHLGPP